MIKSPPAPKQPSLIERMEPPRSVLPRWVHTLLGVKPAAETPAQPEAPASAEQRTAYTGPTCRSYPH